MCPFGFDHGCVPDFTFCLPKSSEEEMTHYFWSENYVSGNIIKWFINKWSLDSIEGRKEGKNPFSLYKNTVLLETESQGNPTD